MESVKCTSVKKNCMSFLHFYQYLLRDILYQFRSSFRTLGVIMYSIKMNHKNHSTVTATFKAVHMKHKKQSFFVGSPPLAPTNYEMAGVVDVEFHLS